MSDRRLVSRNPFALTREPFACGALACTFACLVGLAVSASSIRAQNDAHTPVAFDARHFRDSLSHISERRTIRDIEAKSARIKTAPSADAAGFAALRSFELSHVSDDAKHARLHFETAHELDKNDAWALYGWALATLPQIKADDDPGRFGFAGDNELSNALGLDPKSRARRAVEKAVAIDPSFTEAAQLLARLAAETNDKSALRQATTTLTDLVEKNPTDAGPRLALATAANATGDLEAAATAARSAAALSTGAAASTAHHAAARALLRMTDRQVEGAEEYFLGLDSLTREEATHYYDELRGIATTSEMADLERLPVANAGSWIRTFWNMHAALSAMTVSDRLAVHFQRLGFAEKNYTRRTHFGATVINAMLLDRPKSSLDDRGVIYVRHGKPDKVLFSVVGAARAHPVTLASWVYNSEGGKPVLYHFTDGATEEKTGFSDWYLMYKLSCDESFLESAALYDPRVAPLLADCSPANLGGVSAQVRRNEYDGLRSESVPAAFTTPLAATYDVYTFRGANRATDIVAALGVQADRLKPLVLDNGLHLYSVKTSFIVVDTAARTVVRRDTTIQASATDAANHGSIVVGNLDITTNPMRGALHRMSVADSYVPSRGHLYGGPLRVPDYSGDTLMISDIVLAAPDSAGTFHRGAVSLTLVPWQIFPKGSFRVFYELYNVSPGDRYSTELRMEPASRGTIGSVTALFGHKPAVSMKFEEVAPATGTTIQQVRDATALLAPGQYNLTVVITDKRTGQKITKVRPVTITK